MVKTNFLRHCLTFTAMSLWLCLMSSTVNAGAFMVTDLMKLLSQQKSGRATFVEKKYLAILDKPIESSGEMSFTAPDKLMKHTLKPKSELLLLEGDKLTMTQGEKRPLSVNLQENLEVATLVESIRGTLSGDLATLEKNYNLELSGDAEKWQLMLTPIRTDVVKIIRRIRIGGANAFVKTIEFEQTDGDHFEMTISKVVPQ